MPARKTTRKIETCPFCDNPSPGSFICDECNEVLNRHELLYLDGLAGNAEARKALKKLSRAERVRIAPSILTEDDLDAFVNRGIITGRHQIAMRPVRAAYTKEITMPAKTTTRTRAQIAAERKAQEAAAEMTIEVTNPRRRTDKTKHTVKVDAAKTATRVARHTVNVAEIARAANIDAKKFRAFLRTHEINLTDNKSAAAAVRKFKAASK